MHHGIYIMGCIWQPCCILQEKVGISFYFWIIRLVNRQLALYSDVICNPLNTPKTPLKHPPHMTITNVNYEGLYLPGVICNIVVKAYLGRWTPQTNPQIGRLTYFHQWQPPKCIMGYILWDVFGSHFGFFKKRWKFPFISE